MVSVNDLKGKIASGVVFAGFDGGLSDRLDWWAGIWYYNSSGRGHCSPGHTGKMLRWECVTRGRGVNLEGNLNGVVGVRAL